MRPATVRRRASAPTLLALAALVACVRITPPNDPPRLDTDEVQRGARLFVDPKLSGDDSRACNTCHPGGASDNRFYREGEPVAAGSEGARRPPPLRGAWQTAPYLWDGSASLRDALDRMLRVEMRGAVLEAADRAALASYVLSIPRFDSRVADDGSPLPPATPAVSSGFAAFQRAECGVCHRPPSFTTGLRRDAGTGGRISVPTLRGLSQLQAPYGRDGRWPSLDEAVAAMARNRGVELSAEEVANLVEYLRLL